MHDEVSTIAGVAPNRDVLTPSQLNTLARDLLEGAFPLIWVEGELGNLSRPSSGHLYFTLKDARAQVRCALFKPKSQWLKFVPRDGLRVLARGRLTLYEARGDYQLVLDHMEEAGEGALRRAFERAQGEARRRRPVRRRAQASPARLRAPARRDHLARAARRCATCSACWRGASRCSRRDPAGAGPGRDAPRRRSRPCCAAPCQRSLRCLLLTRGGGSLEDLWAFNDEGVARAIAASRVPVVSRGRPRDRLHASPTSSPTCARHALGRGRTAGPAWGRPAAAPARAGCAAAQPAGAAPAPGDAARRSCRAAPARAASTGAPADAAAAPAGGPALPGRWRGGGNSSIAMPACAMPTRCCARCSRGGGWHACMSGWRRASTRAGSAGTAPATRCHAPAWPGPLAARGQPAGDGRPWLRDPAARRWTHRAQLSVTRPSAMRSMRGWWMGGCACRVESSGRVTAAFEERGISTASLALLQLASRD